MKRSVTIIFIFIAIAAFPQKLTISSKQCPTLFCRLSEGNRTMLLVDTGRTVIPYSLGEIEKFPFARFSKIQTRNRHDTIEAAATINGTHIVASSKPYAAARYATAPSGFTLPNG